MIFTYNTLKVPISRIFVLVVVATVVMILLVFWWIRKKLLCNYMCEQLVVANLQVALADL